MLKNSKNTVFSLPNSPPQAKIFGVWGTFMKKPPPLVDPKSGTRGGLIHRNSSDTIFGIKNLRNIAQTIFSIDY